VARKAGGIDVSFNLISHGDVQGTPMAEMSLESMRRQLASELGPNGVRVVTLRTAACPSRFPGTSTGARRSPAGSSGSRCSDARRR
jgi:hypothetical protein